MIDFGGKNVMNKKTKEMIKRYVIFLIGLFINSLGVSFVTKASLGTSPISSIPYVLSLNFPFTLGEFTIYFSILLILFQIAILGKDFKLDQLLQIPVSLAFGYFIDICMLLLGFVQPSTYLFKIIYLVIGCVILGIGVYMEVLANVIMLPGESFVRSIVFRWKTEFGLTKICFDVSMFVIAVVLSFIFAGKLMGVREGTIIAALLVGYIARTLGKKLAFLPDKIYGIDSVNLNVPEEKQENAEPICVCIGRQFGSGGRELSKKLAEQLGYHFYDREIIHMAANTTGYSEAYIERQEEKMTNSLLYDLVTQMYAYTNQYEAPKDAIFEAEAEVIQNASKENCVIVGRCADWILRKHKKVISVFFTAPTQKRVQKIMNRENLSEKDAKEKIKQIDKLRAENYRYYTGKLWGMASNYQICIDTSLGDAYVITAIKEVLNQME